MAKKSEKKQETRNSDTKVEKILVENFVSLQKVMVNLSLKLDDLTNQISKLLNLFEISAKALAEKEPASEKDSKNTKDIADKIDNILEQNKVIARGLTLLHEPISPEPPQKQNLQQISQPIRPFRTSLGVEKYQKSMPQKYQQEFKPEESS